MSFPDSYTRLFTKIPRHIEKQWRLRKIDVQTKLPVADQAARHAESIVESVHLNITFNRQICEQLTTIDESLDAENSEIQIWQEARKAYVALDIAINEVIQTLVNDVINQAKNNKIRTADVLTQTTTNSRVEPIHAQNDLRTFSPANIRSSAQQSSKVVTVMPDDSISQVRQYRRSKKSPTTRRSFF